MQDDLIARPGAATRDILSVSQLNRKARQLLETHLPLLWVEGEVSNFAAPSSGHWYFTLKDRNAQVRCAMFRNRNNMVRFKPGLGKQVVVRCRVSLYEGRGEYQLIVEHMEEAGFGVLQRAFEALKAKLDGEGLFSESHKQPPPPLPRHIAVITSPTGAAIRDILHVLARRFPAIPVTVLPVAVQGEGAARQICTAIERANQSGLFDVILLARGGGSLEDLWPFNEEIVARAVFASELPVVCGVGHEVDFSIADFVADVRAPTPSAAAELLSPDRQEWLQTCRRFELQFSQIARRHIAESRSRLRGLSARLRHPGERLQHRAQQLDQLELRLRRCMQQKLETRRERLDNLAARHRRCLPRGNIRQRQQRVVELSRQLQRCSTLMLQNREQRLSRLGDLLDAVSPLKTLGRGYSLSLNQRGEILRSTEALRPGDQLTTKLAAGEILSTVDAVHKDYEALQAVFANSGEDGNEA